MICVDDWAWLRGVLCFFVEKSIVRYCLWKEYECDILSVHGDGDNETDLCGCIL